MGDDAFSPDTFDELPSYQHLNPQEKISQFLGDLHQIPQSISDNLQTRSEHSWRSGSGHKLLHPMAASSIDEDFASEFGSESRHSGASRDSGYFSVNSASSISSLKSGHAHWCFICMMPRAMITCEGWKRHMRQHETTYPCLACNSQEGTDRAPVFSRKSDFLQHLKKQHGIINGFEQADSWGQTRKMKYYSCGFCICLFRDLPEYLNHIDCAHFQYHQTLEHWDQNKVILGLLQQPGVAEAWQRMLPLNLDQDAFAWDFSAVSELERRLELSDDEPEALAKLAFQTSMVSINDLSQQDINSPVSRTISRAEILMPTQNPRRCASKTLRKLARTERGILRLYEGHMDARKVKQICFLVSIQIRGVGMIAAGEVHGIRFTSTRVR